MKLFKIKNENIEQIKNDPFKLERDIQDVVEKNVNTLFDVEFVKSEYKIQNFRFDTLCFDNETNSFVIIEYKKGSSYSVIDQGYSYLSKMLNKMQQNDDAKEGLSAFKEKRKPNWTGN